MKEKDLEKLLEMLGSRVKPGILFRIRMHFRLRNAAKACGLIGKRFSLLGLTLKPALATIGILVFVLGGTSVYAYTNPRVTEGTLLYPLKRAIERVEKVIAVSDETSEAEFHLKMALRRREEIKILRERDTAENAVATKEPRETPEARATRREAIKEIQAIRRTVNAIQDSVVREAVVTKLQEKTTLTIGRPVKKEKQEELKIPEGPVGKPEGKIEEKESITEKKSGETLPLKQEESKNEEKKSDETEIEKTLERTLQDLKEKPLPPPPTPEAPANRRIETDIESR